MAASPTLADTAAATMDATGIHILHLWIRCWRFAIQHANSHAFADSRLSERLVDGSGTVTLGQFESYAEVGDETTSGSFRRLLRRSTDSGLFHLWAKERVPAHGALHANADRVVSVGSRIKIQIHSGG